MSTKYQQLKKSKQAAFLAAYSKMANISYAAKAANIERTTHYLWMRQDKDYVKKFERAFEDACDLLEAEATRRATEGVEEPVFYQGVQCGTIRRYSDTLLIFMLKAARPDKFKDRKELSGKDGGPIQLKVTYEEESDRSVESLA